MKYFNKDRYIKNQLVKKFQAMDAKPPSVQ